MLPAGDASMRAAISSIRARSAGCMSSVPERPTSSSGSYPRTARAAGDAYVMIQAASARTIRSPECSASSGSRIATCSPRWAQSTRAMRGADLPRWPAGAPEPLPREQDRQRGAHREHLLEQHDQARQALVGHGREGEQPVRLARVDVVQRAEAEDQDVAQHRPQPEQRQGDEDPAAAGEAPRRERVDDLAPHQEPDEQERGVLEVVQPAVADRRVVQRRHVPGGVDQGPGGECHRRAEEPAGQGGEDRRVGQATEQRGRQDEERERPAQAEQEERRGEIAEQDVLQHVGREQVALADRVDRRDHGQHQDRDPGAERREPAGVGQVGPPPAQAQPPPQVQDERQQRAPEHHGLLPRPGPEPGRVVGEPGAAERAVDRHLEAHVAPLVGVAQRHQRLVGGAPAVGQARAEPAGGRVGGHAHARVRDRPARLGVLEVHRRVEHRAPAVEADQALVGGHVVAALGARQHPRTAVRQRCRRQQQEHGQGRQGGPPEAAVSGHRPAARAGRSRDRSPPPRRPPGLRA